MTSDQPTGAHLVLTDVTKRYPTGRNEHLTATDHVSLDIPAGGSVALVGASDSGKSTLLHLLGAMDTADSGSVTVDGVDLASLNRGKLAAYRRTVGFVFQRFHLLPALTVEDNVLAPLLPYRGPPDRKQRARDLLDAVGLTGRETALPSQLSGGQQQRVAIARALANKPRLLLADEPTGNLDTNTGTEVLDLLFALQTQAATTIVLATHEHHVAARCNRIVRLRDGTIIEDITLTNDQPTDLLNQISRLQQR